MSSDDATGSSGPVTADGDRTSLNMGTVSRDLDVTASRSSVTAELDGTDRVRVQGERNGVTLTGVTDDLTVDVSADRNSLTLKGRGATVTLQVSGEGNGITVAESLDFLPETGEATGTSINVESFETGPPELVRTTKSDALSEAGLFGVETLSYQTEVDRNHCGFCGRDADVVVQRRSETVALCFGVPMPYPFVDDTSSEECEECTHHADPELSE